MLPSWRLLSCFVTLLSLSLASSVHRLGSYAVLASLSLLLHLFLCLLCIHCVRYHAACDTAMSLLSLMFPVIVFVSRTHCPLHTSGHRASPAFLLLAKTLHRSSAAVAAAPPDPGAASSLLVAARHRDQEFIHIYGSVFYIISLSWGT